MLSITEGQPIVEPVTLDEVKNALRIDGSNDDAMLTGFITGARQWAETYTRRAFFNRTVTLNLDAFPYWEGTGTIPTRQRHAAPLYSAYWDSMAIRLPKPRCVEVASVSFVDLNDTATVLDPMDYYVDYTSQPARVVPSYGFDWPSAQLYQPGTVTVTYTAGSYGDGVTINKLPQNVATAIMLHVKWQYLQFISITPPPDPTEAIKALLNPVKFLSFGYGNT